MASFQQRFELVQAPTDPDEAARLSLSVTQRLGSKGWQVVSVVSSGPVLILVLEQPM